VSKRSKQTSILYNNLFTTHIFLDIILLKLLSLLVPIPLGLGQQQLAILLTLGLKGS